MRTPTYKIIPAHLTVLCWIVFFAAPAFSQMLDPEAVRGGALFRQLGCKECHTVLGEGGGGETKAPELTTVFDEIIEMDDGEQILADEAYLLNSIVDPDAQVVKDYPRGKMPSRFANLPESDLAALVSYVKLLADTERVDELLAATTPQLKEFGPARTAVEMWILVGLSSLLLAASGIHFMSRRISWRWIGLIAAIPAMGVALGVGWANIAASTGGGFKEFNVTARQFAFDPPIIRVNKGDNVTVTLQSEDTLHGFYIDGYGIDEEVRPGETIQFAFVANKSGRFGYRCSHTCGVFHPFMIGTLIVAPNNLFSGSLGLVFGLGLAAFVYVAKKEE